VGLADVCSVRAPTIQAITFQYATAVQRCELAIEGGHLAMLKWAW